MLDFYLSLEQQKREQQDLDAVYEDGDREGAVDGRWDGLIGADPKLPQDNRYWFAYCDALRSVWLKKLGIELEEEF